MFTIYLNGLMKAFQIYIKLAYVGYVLIAYVGYSSLLMEVTFWKSVLLLLSMTEGDVEPHPALTHMPLENVISKNLWCFARLRMTRYL